MILVVRVIQVGAVTNKNIVDSVNTLGELQQLVDTNPALYFENLDGEHGFSGKFIIAQHHLKFSEDVIYEYAGKGLSASIMLMRTDISDELRYYLRTLQYGVEAVNALYFNPKKWAKNEAHLDKIADVISKQFNIDNDDETERNLQYELEELTSQNYIQ